MSIRPMNKRIIGAARVAASSALLLATFGAPGDSLLAQPAPQATDPGLGSAPIAVQKTVEADAADAEESCTFAIRASNSLSFDVWVFLYDSRVKWDGTRVFNFWKQLKIQNHRIASRKSMDRRYTTGGRCSLNRTWKIKVKRGGRAFWIYKSTGGSDSDSRTVDLGSSSRWVNWGWAD